MTTNITNEAHEKLKSKTLLEEFERQPEKTLPELVNSVKFSELVPPLVRNGSICLSLFIKVWSSLENYQGYNIYRRRRHNLLEYQKRRKALAKIIFDEQPVASLDQIRDIINANIPYNIITLALASYNKFTKRKIRDSEVFEIVTWVMERPYQTDDVKIIGGTIWDRLSQHPEWVDKCLIWLCKIPLPFVNASVMTTAKRYFLWADSTKKLGYVELLLQRPTHNEAFMQHILEASEPADLPGIREMFIQRNNGVGWGQNVYWLLLTKYCD